MKIKFYLMVVAMQLSTIGAAQCDLTVAVSGVYSIPFTNAYESISTNGSTFIPANSDVVFDVNPSNSSFILLNAGFETDLNASFLATIQTPCVLSLEENNKDADFSLFPNPARDVLNLQSNFIFNTIFIYDLNGRIIKSLQTQTSSVIIDVSAMNPGVYLVVAKTIDRTLTTKLIKQ
ncbi:MAG: T9SS type A sorting domain-containing protein [Pyrinomonadaceae bacterium]|jgi:hypothetical protein|nr:T9SS type A sorting domain-containing protein [Pyrinomonadaceae bacterium]